MFPELHEVFSGDLLYLTCSPDANTFIKWYFNGKEQPQNGTWKISAASHTHSGDYECEHNGQKSEIRSIKVLGSSPMASLTIATGQPVMMTGQSVVLQLETEESLMDWECKVYRREKKEMKTIKVRHNNNTVIFQPKALTVPETIFWCISRSNHGRSNQVVVRTSDKEVSLEMYPLPAVVGENVILRCLVWGTDQISNTVFYKNKAVISNTHSSQHVITNVTESSLGKYKCQVIYTHVARTGGPPYIKTSDPQELLFEEHPVKAVVYENQSLSCYCPLCPTGHIYKWYNKNGQRWKRLGMTPESSGTYACRGVWKTGRSFLSSSYVYSKSHNNLNIVLIVCGILCGILIIGVVLYHHWKTNRQDHPGPEYEEVGLRIVEAGENKYEALQRKTGDKQQAEYDILTPTGSEKREGSNQSPKEDENKYQALQRKTGDKQQAEYDILTPTGSEKREGSNQSPKEDENKYQALQRKTGDKQQAEYDILTPTGSEKREGSNQSPKEDENKYQALQRKTGDKQQAEYDILTPTSSEKREGDYQSLNTEETAAGVYHTIGLGEKNTE
ncbi:uncharacterized protein LOC103381736 isoform X2 [Cynoglossus semilaevis]|nr:uncharacterized protein LOC103381736 isoform X2 [Cynoglossus semilaevis]